jgi:hypothetical protein
MESYLNLTAQQLRRAAELKEKIEALQEDLNKLLGTPAQPGAATAPARKRTLSPAAIARIRAAQKARWAAHRASRPQTPSPAPRRKLSPAARARLAAVAKARWAKVKAAGKKAL